MHVAKTGLNSQQTKMQVIANNLANVNTTGFKKDRVNFESLLYQIQRSQIYFFLEIMKGSNNWPKMKHREK